jgi:DNA-directed RNA polymerase specialized sigma24 family protein
MNIENINLIKLKNGNEAGLSYFYRRFFPWYTFRAFRYMKDDLDAQCAVQEAFLRLWLNRAQVDSVESMHEFLKRQVQEAAKAFHRKRSNEFRKSMLYYFDYDDPDILIGHRTVEEEVTEELQPDASDQEKLDSIHRLLPHLGREQELFIRLCLRFNFNYERIAFYLGGIRDYEVANKVNKCIVQLKTLVADSSKLSRASKMETIRVDERLTPEQAEVLKLRYELGASFDDIGQTLQLPVSRVREIFIQAFTVFKHGKNHSYSKNTVSYSL